MLPRRQALRKTLPGWAHLRFMSCTGVLALLGTPPGKTSLQSYVGQRHVGVLHTTIDIQGRGDFHGISVRQPVFYSHGLLQFGEETFGGTGYGSRRLHESQSFSGPRKCNHISTGVGRLAAELTSSIHRSGRRATTSTESGR